MKNMLYLILKKQDLTEIQGEIKIAKVMSLQSLFLRAQMIINIQKETTNICRSMKIVMIMHMTIAMLAKGIHVAQLVAFRGVHVAHLVVFRGVRVAQHVVFRGVHVAQLVIFRGALKTTS
jgi:hypothetical protein